MKYNISDEGELLIDRLIAHSRITMQDNCNKKDYEQFDIHRNNLINYIIKLEQKIIKLNKV